MLIGTAVSTSVLPAAPVQPAAVNSYEIVSDASLKAEANIDVPAKSGAMSRVAVVSETTLAKPVFMVKTTVTDKLDAWLNGLIQKESSGRTNIKILDVNNRYSYGCLQFQKPTFIAYGRKYGFVSGEEANLESLLMSCSLQKAIARKMILDDASNWRHWYTSVAVKNLGLPPVDESLTLK